MDLSKYTGTRDDILSICEASSALNNGYECKYGLNGRFEDAKGGIWKTHNEGIGSWMKLLFKENVLPAELVIMQPESKHEMNRKIELCYSESNCEDFELLRKEGGVMSFNTKEAVPTNRILINVKSVWSTINNGFSLMVKG